ncbi:NAD(P)/FAD-dependent oxidoreductase [Peptoniphilus sp. KCTC 25270]|uniref:NAD(P)/FAD-dependent oxidoreductase n=1 Tax=Peptoniphilus sp. KCTC 25270 TaxID=2897414 RepID=UPI001E2B8962|nr:NAD(P)/FAD-dependent oxidoreductase [Peptoniphilus sp. KCTC 25270]MCD1147135.1 NAD(P)/FAD-dependent oxidoreductase [Peptoniphilus sp. KCTC 25270]
MKIGVVGGGPGGMMAAIWAARSGNHEIHLFEKNEKLGKKLFITGKGRCNLCNDCEDSYFFEQVVNNSSFLYSSYYTFPPYQTMEFFESLGLHLKVERGNRVFPKSDHSSDVIKALQKELEKQGVQIHLKEEVKSLEKKKNFVLGTNRNQYELDKVILATGGITYSSTGSTGDGYVWAKHFGHKLIETRAGLVGIKTNQEKKENLMGLTLKNVELYGKTKRKTYRFFGDLLLTHYGISGPIALSMSSYINREKNPEIWVDLKPALTKEQLDQRMQREIQKQSNRSLQKIMETLLPKSLVGNFLSQWNLDHEKKANQITKEERSQIIEGLKKYPLPYKGLFQQDTGIITSGGVSVKEIDPSTMESKKVEGLYFVGEMMDVDALTGGFNLQIAFSTGHLAGVSVGSEERK